MALPIQNDTKGVLNSRIKKHAIVDFFESGMSGLTKEVNKTIDVLIGSQWPKAYFITKKISDYELSKVKISSDIIP